MHKSSLARMHACYEKPASSSSSFSGLLLLAMVNFINSFLLCLSYSFLFHFINVCNVKYIQCVTNQKTSLYLYKIKYPFSLLFAFAYSLCLYLASFSFLIILTRIHFLKALAFGIFISKKYKYKFIPFYIFFTWHGHD